MEDVPRVSAIIPAHNAERYLSDAIDSVLGQTYRDVECVVIDDGSTDGTLAVAQRYEESVTLLKQENRGVSAARNRGAQAARGELLAFLDADDRWLPERVKRGVEELRRCPELEAVVCATSVVDARLRPLGMMQQDPSVTPRDMLLCRARTVSASSNLLIRRRAFEEIGGFDQSLSTSADWALMLRLVQRRRLGALPQPLVEYRVHGANMSSSVERFERDMLSAFDRVFAEAPAELRPLRRRAYANLRRMIAGSYFVQGQLGPFARQAVRSIAEHPSTIPYFLGMPVRRLRRARSAARDPLTSLPGARRPPG